MTNLTPSQIQRMVAETLGWKTQLQRWPEGDKTCWFKEGETGTFGVSEPPNFHESLDACHEAFEKDAPEEYWCHLLHVLYPHDRHLIPGQNNHYYRHHLIAVARATPTQRCEAFLRWKGVIL